MTTLKMGGNTPTTTESPTPGPADQNELDPKTPLEANDSSDADTASTMVDTVEGKKLRTFADVAAGLPNDDPEAIPGLDSNAVSYFYRHRTVRDFRYGKWHFRDFMLTIRSEEENQKFLDDFIDMPLEERTQIVEYHPDMAAKVESEVGAVRANPQVHRGPAGTSQFKDPKLLSQAKPN